MRTFGLRGEAKRLAMRKRTEMRSEYFGADEVVAEDAGVP
jgi:hypothetical protein